MAIFKLLVPEGNQRLAEPQVDHQLMRSWCASSEPSFQAQLWLLPQRWSSGNSSLDRAPSMCKDFWFQIHVRWTAAVFLLIRCPRIIYIYIYTYIYIYICHLGWNFSARFWLSNPVNRCCAKKNPKSLGNGAHQTHPDWPSIHDMHIDLCTSI